MLCSRSLGDVSKCKQTLKALETRYGIILINDEDLLSRNSLYKTQQFSERVFDKINELADINGFCSEGPQYTV
jgi:hypothetical protein